MSILSLFGGPPPQETDTQKNSEFLCSLTEEERVNPTACKIPVVSGTIRNIVGVAGTLAAGKLLATATPIAASALATKALLTGAAKGAFVTAVETSVVKGTGAATPMSWIMPLLPKQPDYLGFMHLRNKCVAVSKRKDGRYDVKDEDTTCMVSRAEGRKATWTQTTSAQCGQLSPGKVGS
jgi:hypothetical protein